MERMGWEKPSGSFFLDIFTAKRIIGLRERAGAMAGFNSKIDHQGVTYLVQTQDMGRPSNCVESLIYKAGRALAPRKTSYTQHLNKSTLQEKINQLMEEQHKAILQAISEGKYDHF
jgi:hypothetical protein